MLNLYIGFGAGGGDEARAALLGDGEGRRRDAAAAEGEGRRGGLRGEERPLRRRPRRRASDGLQEHKTQDSEGRGGEATTRSPGGYEKRGEEEGMELTSVAKEEVAAAIGDFRMGFVGGDGRSRALCR